MDAIVQRLRAILAKILEFWNKFNTKQKVILISVVSGIVLLIVVLSFILTRPEMETLYIASNPSEASKIITYLDNNGIKHKVSKDATTIMVDKRDYSKALLALGDNGIPAMGMTLEELFNNSFSTTESEKKLKANIYKQDWLRNALIGMEHVSDAVVSISEPDTGNTIFDEGEETSVSVILTVDSDFRSEAAKTIANILAGAVGNKTTDNIKISDQNGTLLFSQSEDLLNGNVGSMLEYQQDVSNIKVEALYKLLVGIPSYDDARIVPNFVFDMDQMTECYEEYTVAEGNEQGYLSHNYVYEAINAVGNGGTPGTDSNDETDYMIESTASEGSSVNINENDYLPNKRVTNLVKAVGAIKSDSSSIAINLISYRKFDEAELKASGQLEDKTFDQFITENNTVNSLEVTDEVYNLVAQATGISRNSIQILAWEVPIFQPIVKKGFTWSDWLMIALAVLIVGILIFVLIKGSTPVEVTDIEPELSVEQLLATTKENQSLDDIEFSDKSETRKLIEKFVDENPEAVASLLRNWLQDDWG